MFFCHHCSTMKEKKPPYFSSLAIKHSTCDISHMYILYIPNTCRLLYSPALYCISMCVDIYVHRPVFYPPTRMMQCDEPTCIVPISYRCLWPGLNQQTIVSCSISFTVNSFFHNPFISTFLPFFTILLIPQVL